MNKIKCPACGNETVADARCGGCEHAASNGAACKPESAPPPEVATWVIERPSPEMLEEARRTFDEAEFLAGVHEIEQGGGVTFEQIIAKIERKLHGGT